MKEYIERAKAFDICQKEYDYYCDTTAWTIGAAIKSIPAADVVEVRHGEWLLKHVGVGHYWECSVCHAPPNIYITEDTNYCPNCGARMDKEDEHETN